MNKADIDGVEAKVFNGALSEIGWTDGSTKGLPAFKGLKQIPSREEEF